MANTLKFGNGQWATGNGTALAYNDENANFKPLPFDFTRASSGTTVNQSGLIETVGSGIPRIDFQGNTKGALKLEPSRTNLITYSEDFSNAFWTKSGASVTSGFVSPDGTANAYKLVEDSANSTHFSYSPNLTVSNGATLTTSIFVKSAGRDWFLLQESTTDYGYYFNNGQVGSAFGSPLSYKIDELANGWYKYSITTVTPNTNGRLKLQLAESDGVISYQGDGVSGVYIFGAQLEQGSYATSYIPTSGSAVTRVADDCSQTVPDGVIGQTEGTIYAKINISNTTTKTILSLDSGSASNFIILDTSSSLSPQIKVRQSSGSFPSIITGSTMSYGVNKIAFCYKSGDYAMYVNGVLSGTSTSTTFPSGIISKISVGANTSYGYLSDTVSDLKLYNTRLSNAELAALTQV